MELKSLHSQKMYDIYLNSIQKGWKYKSFKDFNYLSFEPTSGQLIFVYVMTLVSSKLTMFWVVRNEFNEEN